MPTLDLGSGGGVDTLNGIVNFISKDGGSAAKVLTASLTGLLISPFVAIIDIIDAIATFATAPITGTSNGSPGNRFPVSSSSRNVASK